MIHWQDVAELHVVRKLEEIVEKWFSVNLLYINSHGKIQGIHWGREGHFINQFLKTQQSTMDGGQNLLEKDFQTIYKKHCSDETSLSCLSETSFPSVKMLHAKIIIENEIVGGVIAYPFLEDSVTEEEEKHLHNFLQDLNISPEKATQSLSYLSKLNIKESEYLSEILELLADEVVTFHEEISKREEIIHDLHSELGKKIRHHSMIGKSEEMQKIYNLLEKLSHSEISVLIQGENGTGKELIAKAIHYDSCRKDNIFITINCSAFNDNLLDSELFGHIKGSFTGAVKDKKGLFGSAHGGTIFLDEVGDTSLAMQAKLLRVLQEGTYLPVGATRSQMTDVRVISATNKDLQKMMSLGEFREDLFYRLNVINVSLPPLRKRVEDISILIDHFLKKKCTEMDTKIKTISKECMEKIFNYKWPGNIRELKNEMERLIVLSAHDSHISQDLLSPRILNSTESLRRVEPLHKEIDKTGKLKTALEELEFIMISEGLQRCHFNKSKLSKELGISRAGLISKVEKYGLDQRKKVA